MPRPSCRKRIELGCRAALRAKVLVAVRVGGLHDARMSHTIARLFDRHTDKTHISRLPYALAGRAPGRAGNDVCFFLAARG